jgi:DNA modification methylase
MKLLLGDCLEVLKPLPENSVDAVVTDPPYGLSFMGKKWDYDVPSVEIWKECLRVLKPGGHLLSFAGTRTHHRICSAIEDAGFEIRDMIAWVYGSGFPKSLNIGKAVDKLQGNKRKSLGITKGVGNNNTESMNSGVSKSSEFNHEYELTKGTSEWEGWGTALKPALEPITVARKPLSEKSVAENCLKWGTGGINID